MSSNRSSDSDSCAHLSPTGARGLYLGDQSRSLVALNWPLGLDLGWRWISSEF